MFNDGQKPKQKLTQAGKITIAKTFLISRLNYIIQALSLPKAISAQTGSIIIKFLWQKKALQQKALEMIRRNNNMCKGISNEGLGAVSSIDKQNSLIVRA